MKHHYVNYGIIILFLLIIPFAISCEKNDNITDELPVYMISEFSDPDPELVSAVINAVTPERVYAYPNPFEVLVNIHSSQVPDQIIIIYEDGNSRKYKPSGSNSRFDFSSAKPGLYYCEVLLDGKVFQLDLIKVKF